MSCPESLQEAGHLLELLLELVHFEFHELLDNLKFLMQKIMIKLDRLNGDLL
jgi:hypothetical protein